MDENIELRTEENVDDNKDVTEKTETEENLDHEQDEYDYEESRVVVFLKRIFNIKVLAVLVAVVLLVQAFTGVILAEIVLNPDGFLNSEKSGDVLTNNLSNQSQIDWLTVKSIQKSIKNEDDAEIHALELKNYDTCHSYIILCHPMTSDAKDMAVYAYHFFDLGFNVLIPEARGYGESEYKKINMGWLDRYDVLLWVDEIIKNDSNASVFLFGVGMGGSTVLMASSLDLPKNVKGIISDSAYSDVHSAFKANIKNIYAIPSFPVVNMASLYVQLTQGWSFKENSALEQVKNAKVPVLFIHGSDDEVIPVSQSNDMYEACSAKGSDHLLISGASHAQTLSKNSEKYWLNVDLFILDNIQNTP